MHHPPLDPHRTASAKPATVTVATAYEGAVIVITECSNPVLTCPDGGVRFGGYNGRVMTTNAPTSVPAAEAVAR